MGNRKGSARDSKSDEFTRWSAYVERSKAIDNYTSVLRGADQDSITQLSLFTKQIQKLYRGTMMFHIAVLVAVAVIFGLSIFFVLSQKTVSVQFIIGSIGLPVSLITLLVMAYKTPLRSAREIVGEVIKMQVIFLGYIRQMNQSDIGFKQSVVSMDKAKAEEFQKAFEDTRKILEKSLDDINLLLDDLG
jgi:uncharacterized integral membrane protein